MLLDDVAHFLRTLEGWDFLFFFWPFFLFDFTRYVLLDLVLIPRYLWHRRRDANFHRHARRKLFQESPLISVIAPGKNEGKHIPKLTESLGQQTYKHIEIIIVDDGSNDDTPHICRRLLQEGRIDRFVRNEVRGGKASAANTALNYVNGKYVVHLDADSHLGKDAIEQILLPFYLDNHIAAVGGDIRVANNLVSFATRLQTIEYMKSLTTGRTVSSELGILRIIAGAFGAFRTDILQRLGGWDVGPGLDGDITVKIRKLGYRVVHRPEAACYTNVPDTFRKLAKQRYRWDRSMVRFRMRKHVDILLPTANFQLRNFVASAENIFYNFVLDIKWWFYIIQLSVFFPHQLAVVMVVNYGLYTLAGVLEFAVAMLLLGRTSRPVERAMAWYLPLTPLYTGVYLRTVRTFAYIMELVHKASYSDRWNPWKVSSIAKRNKL